MNLSDQKLDQLLKKMLNEMNTVQGLGEVSGSALKRELMDSIGSAYKTWHTSKNKLYAASDKALAEAGAMPAIQNQVKAYSSVFKEILNRADVEDVLFKYQGKPVTYLKELAEDQDLNYIPKTFLEMYDEDQIGGIIRNVEFWLQDIFEQFKK